MAVATEISKEIILKYADKGTFRFNKVSSSATDQQLYNLADILNSFQTEPVRQVIKSITKVIV